MIEQTEQIKQIRQAFEQEFGRFADLSFGSVDLIGAEALLREIRDLKIKHTGKKSAIAGAMKLIGKVAPEERGEFGQFVQSVSKEIADRIDDVEAKLGELITAA